MGGPLIIGDQQIRWQQLWRRLQARAGRTLSAARAVAQISHATTHHNTTMQLHTSQRSHIARHALSTRVALGAYPSGPPDFGGSPAWFARGPTRLVHQISGVVQAGGSGMWGHHGVVQPPRVYVRGPPPHHLQDKLPLLSWPGGGHIAAAAVHAPAHLQDKLPLLSWPDGKVLTVSGNTERGR